MQDFISKISAKNVFIYLSLYIIIKTCSAQTPVSGTLPPNPHQGLYTWTLLGDFRPPDLLITSPGFPVSSHGSSGSRRRRSGIAGAGLSLYARLISHFNIN